MYIVYEVVLVVESLYMFNIDILIVVIEIYRDKNYRYRG